MEPRIQYAKTEDGVNIAYSVQGEGRPLVAMAGWPWTHLRAELSVPTYRLFHEALAAHRQYVRLDFRGTGLSDRNPDDVSFDARVLDVEAVADRVGLEEFDVWAWGLSAPVAVSYAARHQDRLRRLVLWDSALQESAPESIPRLGAMLELMNKDWEMFSETAASVLFGWSAGEPARVFARYLREAVSQEMAVRSLEQLGMDEVRRLFPSLTMPTLVVQSREGLGADMEWTAELTSLLPNASLTVLDGSWITTDALAQAAADAILDFVSEGEGSHGEAPATADTHTILFTDMQSSTTLADQLGDAAAQEVRRAHNEIVRSAVAANGGNEIKHTGDGIMASFSTASAALDSAIAIQRGVAAHKEEHADSPLGVYVGLNAGEPIAEDDDLFGTSINLAARICDHAEAGQILAANVVRELAAGKQFLFADLGETELRGFEDPVKLWELRWQEQ